LRLFEARSCAYRAPPRFSPFHVGSRLTGQACSPAPPGGIRPSAFFQAISMAYMYDLDAWRNFSYLNRVLKDTFPYTRSGLAFFMATEKAETDRVPVTLALSTIAYLEKLVRQGTHGTSVPGVARTLIEEGIRLAIKDGLLSIRDNGKA
jgi:hypothetical protein